MAQVAYELSLLKETAENVIRSLTNERVLQGGKGELKSFLDNNRHFYYHQCYRADPGVCCDCSSDGKKIDLREVLQKESFKKLYRSSGNKRKDHRLKRDGVLIQECLHKYKAKDVTLDDLDIDTLIYIIINCGFKCTNKTEKAKLTTIRGSLSLLNESITEKFLHPDLQIDEIYQALLEITYPRYYRNIIKLLLDDKIQCMGRNRPMKQDVLASVYHDEMSNVSEAQNALQLMKSATSMNMTWRDQIETCTTKKQIENLSLAFQYDVLKKNEETYKSVSKRNPATGRRKRYWIELKISTNKQWKTDGIIDRLKQSTVNLTKGLSIKISQISKGSISMLASVDEVTLADKNICSEQFNTLLSRIVSTGEIPTRKQDEIPVKTKIIGPVDASNSFLSSVMEFMDIKEESISSDSDHFLSLFLNVVNYPMVCRKIGEDHIHVDTIVDNRLEHNIHRMFNTSSPLIQRENFPDILVDSIPYKFMYIYDHLMRDTDLVKKSDLLIDLLVDCVKYSDCRDSELKFECLCRYFLGKLDSCEKNAVVRLHHCLRLALSFRARQIAKAIAWKLVRMFAKTHPDLQYNDIWPGIECNCQKETNEADQKGIYCRSERVVIVVEVSLKEKFPSKKDNFFGLPVIYKVINAMSREAKGVVQYINDVASTTVDISKIKGVSGDDAKNLFSCHRNLTLISKSPVKSNKFQNKRQKFLDKPCIQLYCRVKGILPVGEPHFPRVINSYPTDVMEGYSQLLVHNISIGNEVGFINGSYGTLGGFLKYRGEDAFLTCAHVIFERKHLVPDADLSFIDENTVTIYCKNNSGEEPFPCGTLADHRFPPDASKDGVSIDAAVVKLRNCDIKSCGLKNDYLNNSVPDYNEIGTNTQIRAMALGAVSSIQNKPDETLNRVEYFSAEFETLCTLVEREWQNTNNAGMTDNTHAQMVIQKAGEMERKVPRVVHLFNQISFRNINFAPGDSGMCIYAEDRQGRQGCIGMAIASHPDGGCIVTPMKSILSSLKITCKSP